MDLDCGASRGFGRLQSSNSEGKQNHGLTSGVGAAGASGTNAQQTLEWLGPTDGFVDCPASRAWAPQLLGHNELPSNFHGTACCQSCISEAVAWNSINCGTSHRHQVKPSWRVVMHCLVRIHLKAVRKRWHDTMLSRQRQYIWSPKCQPEPAQRLHRRRLRTIARSVLRERSQGKRPVDPGQYQHGFYSDGNPARSVCSGCLPIGHVEHVVERGPRKHVGNKARGSICTRKSAVPRAHVNDSG